MVLSRLSLCRCSGIFLYLYLPLAEQHRIVAKVNELMALCDQLEEQLSTVQHESGRLLESVLDYALYSSAKAPPALTPAL